jgi:hypothetical protein
MAVEMFSPFIADNFGIQVGAIPKQLANQTLCAEKT